MGTAMTAIPHALPVAVAPGPGKHQDGADDPLVFHARRLRAGWPLGQTPRFSDNVWDLSPAMLKKHERRFILDFALVPASHRQVARELCYAMLSGAVPSGEQRPSSPPSPSSSASCAGPMAASPGWTR